MSYDTEIDTDNDHDHSAKITYQCNKEAAHNSFIILLIQKIYLLSPSEEQVYYVHNHEAYYLRFTDSINIPYSLT